MQYACNVLVCQARANGDYKEGESVLCNGIRRVPRLGGLCLSLNVSAADDGPIISTIGEYSDKSRRLMIRADARLP
jgi:hypothetical protein